MMLTFQELREQNLSRCVSGFGHTLEAWSVAEWGNATAGECGEACNIAKKILRFRDGVVGNKKSQAEYVRDLASEIAGTLIYLDLWAASQNIDLEEAVKDEFNKKSEEIGAIERL
jgi:NTP pyrophosphatase (non-canonical NTP hydrolase)